VPTALLADDEPMMRAALRDHLAMLWPQLQIVAEADDGPSALSALDRTGPDIAFLDIRMPGLTGLEVARATRSKARIVFVTAHDNHAIEAFEANATDYVLKPVAPSRLAKVVAKLRDSLADGLSADAEQLTQLAQMLRQAGAASEAIAQAPSIQWLQVAVGRTIRMVHLNDVLYFESDTKYTRVVSLDCEGLLRMTLKELLDCAGTSAFMQVRRGMAVNRSFIRAVHHIDDTLEIELRGRAERLKVSNAHRPLFKAM